MNLKNFTIALLFCGVGLFTVSCEKDITEVSADAKLSTQGSSDLNGNLGSLKLQADALTKSKFDCSTDLLRQRLVAALADRAVTPSECGPTDLDAAITPYVLQFGDLEWEWYDLLATISQLYTLLDTSEQYFGVEGQSTNFVAKHKRNLESFWGMPNEITLNGQHTKTLLNRDAIAAVYIAFAGLTPAQAYENADYLIEEVIKQSDVLGTTPLLSLDGFATTGNLIVIGDGIVQVLVDAGIDEKVAYAGILAHEWGHQIQFNNFEEWYGVEREDLVSTPESTRLTELEADFLTGYYLTHKRGGTYNWKSSAEFFDLFFNIGDCSFTSTGHHGTPNQRLAAARLGYIIAQETFPKGHILTADELHAIFMASYQDIIENKIDSATAFSSLKTAELKAIYTSILKYESELKSILAGNLNKNRIENLK